MTNVLSCPLAVKGSDRSRHIFGRYDFFAFPIIIKDLSRISVTTCFCHIFVSVCFPSKRPAWPSFDASDIKYRFFGAQSSAITACCQNKKHSGIRLHCSSGPGLQTLYYHFFSYMQPEKIRRLYWRAISFVFPNRMMFDRRWLRESIANHWWGKSWLDPTSLLLQELEMEPRYGSYCVPVSFDNPPIYLVGVIMGDQT